MNGKTLLTTCALSLIGVSSFAKSEKPLNILLILSDDHSAVHLGSAGNPDLKTPHLDALAEDGTLFKRGYVTCPQSAPSRKSVLTGRSTVALQATRFTAPLHESEITFPEILADELNFYTGLTGRIHHIDGSVSPGGEMNHFEALYLEENGFNTAASRFDVCKTTSQKDGGGDRQIEQWIDFMESRPTNRPFFVQLCFTDPHRPYTAPSVYDPATLTLPETYPDTQLVREDLAAYYDELHRLDLCMGRVVDYLKANDLYDNTIVIFIGDNGSAQFRGKGTLYELGINVPMIIRHPKLGNGLIYDGVVSTEDIAPTCLELSGVSIPKNITGESLVTVLKGGERQNEYVFSQRGSHANGRPSDQNALFDMQRSITSKRYKLIYNAIPTLKYSPVDFGYKPVYKEIIEMNKEGKLSPLHTRLYFSKTRPVLELFDLEKDPNEYENLFDNEEYNDVRETLIRELTYWMVRERDFLATPDFTVRKR